MNKYLIILCLCKVKHWLKYLILCLNKLHCLINTALIHSRNNRNRITYESYMFIKNKPVIRTWLRIRLTGTGKTLHILVNILICIYCLYSGYLHCNICINALNIRIGIWRTQKLYNKTILWCNIICIYWLSKKQLHCILFSYRFINRLHYFTSSAIFSLFSTLASLAFFTLR